MPSKSQEQGQDFDHNVDRFPTLQEVFSKVLAAEDIPKGGVLKVEIGCQANGEANYRVWSRDSVEPAEGFFPA